MLEINGGEYRGCDGVSRRRFLRAGVLGLTGLSLADMLRVRAARAEAGLPTRDTSVILIWKGGGPSHLDMWDLKPDAPVEYRGEFKPIPTNVAGIQVGEHLPLSAKVMDKFSIIRSVTHPDSGHESASHYLLTGYRPDQRHPRAGDAQLRLDRLTGPGSATAGPAGLRDRPQIAPQQRGGLPGRRL